MSLALIKIGFFLSISAVLLALHTGNVFGFSRGEKDRIDKIQSGHTRSDEDEARLSFFKINEFIRHLWKVLLALGILIFFVGVSI